MRYSDKSLFCHILTNTAYFETNLSGSHSCDPKVGLTFTFTHSGFQRLGTNRLMRKDPNIHFTFTMQKMCSRNPAGFNIFRTYPAIFQSL
jgi:hypothetical protein